MLEGSIVKFKAAVIAAIVALIVLLSSIGSPVLFPFPSQILFDGPTVADTSGTTTAVVDSTSRRLLILDDKLRLNGVVNLESANYPIDMATHVCVRGDKVYLAGYSREGDSDYVASEQILCFDSSGSLCEQYTVGEDSTESTICGMTAVDDGIIVASRYMGNDYENGSPIHAYRLVKIHDDGSYEFIREQEIAYGIFDVGYNQASDVACVVDLYGRVYRDGERISGEKASGIFVSADVADDGSIYACDDSGQDIVHIDDTGSASIFGGWQFVSVDVSGEYVVACSQHGNLIAISDLVGEETSWLAGIDFAPMMFVRMLVFWIAAAYLSVLAVVVAAGRLRTILVTGDTGSLGPMMGSLAVVLAIGLGVGQLYSAAYDRATQTRSDEINAVADYIARLTDPDLVQELATYGQDRNKVWSAEETASLGVRGPINELMLMANTAQDYDIGIYFRVYGMDDAGIYNVANWNNEYVFGSAALLGENEENVARLFEYDTPIDGTMYTGKTLRDQTLFRLVPISDSDASKVVGVIEIGSSMESLASRVIGTELQRIVGFLVALLVVYLTYSELRACGSTLLRVRMMPASRENDKLAALTRPFTFLVTMLQSMDAVMMVLIAQDLLGKVGTGAASFLLALPAVALGLGIVIGNMLFGRLGSATAPRSLAMCGAVVAAVCAIGVAIAIAAGSFWAFCIARLLMAAPLGMLYAFGYSLQRHAQDDDIRDIASGAVMRTDTSAAALGTVLGGYIAWALGNFWIYLCAAVICIPLLLFVRQWFPRGRVVLDDAPPRGREFLQSMGKLLSGGAIVAIGALLVVPVAASAGYRSFLFPIYTDSLGLSRVDINNLFVFGQLVVFLAIESIRNVKGRLGDWQTTAGGIAGIGVTFVLFFLNRTAVWAVVVIVLVGLFAKTGESWKGLWLRAADANGVPKSIAGGTMFAARNVANIIQPLLLGFFLMFGQRFAIIALGLFCLVCAGGFVLFARRSPVFSPASARQADARADVSEDASEVQGG